MTTRHKVLLGIPGGDLRFGTVQGILSASTGQHEVQLMHEGMLFLDSFNALWARALNAAEEGHATHFAMLHADITPTNPWLDLLLWDMDRLDADLVSAVSPIKDERGVTSSGIGDPDDQWHPYRRFTMHELQAMPDVFDAAGAGYPGKPLLHNTGCWVADLRKPVFYQTDVYGDLLARFEYPHRICRTAKGTWELMWESEDWYFSRVIHGLGAKTYISRKVHLNHRGAFEFPNDKAWGTQTADEGTRYKWGKEETEAEPCLTM